MDRLWAPWRMEYLLDEKPSGCIFCLPATSEQDRGRLVLHRTASSLVMLNRYPYTNGHLLIAPHRHTAEMSDLSDTEMLDLFATVRTCRDVLQLTAKPEGYNIGMNLGRAAGAGVEDHLHLHIVPRWCGDTNYMSVIPDVRVMPENLFTTYDRLLPAFLAQCPSADR
ncbi:MAG TPA: HIT domain-containing protein [Geobacteraceae bacterium]